jgi:hypothetical protein
MKFVCGIYSIQDFSTVLLLPPLPSRFEERGRAGKIKGYLMTVKGY